MEEKEKIDIKQKTKKIVNKIDNEPPVINDNTLVKTCEPYDFRVSEEDREKLLETIKADALSLKEALVKTKFNTLCLRQIGKNYRMFAIRHENDIRIYINAVISGRAGGAIVEQIEESEPDKKYMVLRPQQIRLVYMDEVGEAKETILEGIAAAEAAKQVEREEGVLIQDIGKESPRWDKMTEISKMNAIKEYLKELSNKAENQHLNTDQEEYLKRKEEIKKELKNASRLHAESEHKMIRNIKGIRQSQTAKKPWEA